MRRNHVKTFYAWVLDRWELVCRQAQGSSRGIQSRRISLKNWKRTFETRTGWCYRKRGFWHCRRLPSWLSNRARITCIFKAVSLETTSAQLVSPQNLQSLCPLCPLCPLWFNPGNNLKNISLEIKPQRSRRGIERQCLESQNISTRKLLSFRLIMCGY